MARISRERQATALNRPMIEMFRALVKSAPEAAAIARNSLIETNPRLAWALHGMLSKYHSDEADASQKETAEELRAERESRRSSRYREESPLAGSWIAISAKTALNPSSEAGLVLKEKSLDANGRALAQASVKNGFGSRAAFRLGLRALSREERKNAGRRSSGRAKNLHEQDAAVMDALRDVAVEVLRGPFSEGDCMAFLRVVASAGKAAPKQVPLIEEPASKQEQASRDKAWDIAREKNSQNKARFAMPELTQDQKRRYAEWRAVAASFSTEKRSLEDLELWLREALAAKRPAVARVVAETIKTQSIPREPGFGLHEGRNYGAGRRHSWNHKDDQLEWPEKQGESEREQRRRFGGQETEWLDQALWNIEIDPRNDGGNGIVSKPGIRNPSAKAIDGVFGSKNPRVVETGAALRAGPFALSMLQGLGWEWLKDAGLTPMPAEMGVIARLAPLEDYKALAEWMAEEFTLAQEKQERLAAQAAIEKEAVDKEKEKGKNSTSKDPLEQSIADSLAQLAPARLWAGWGAGGPPKGALTADDVANLAPVFGGEPELWRQIARSIERGNSIEGNWRNVAELTQGARASSEVIDRMKKEHEKWRDALTRENKLRGMLADGTSQAVAAASWISWLDEAAGKNCPPPAHLTARAITPFGDDRTFKLAGRHESATATQSLKECIIEIISRAWLSEWVGPKAWVGFAPKVAPNADGLCFPREEFVYAENRAKHAQRPLLALAEHLAFYPEKDTARFAAGANALKKAPNLNYWGGGDDMPGHGPLLCALLQGKGALTADWIASTANPRMGHAWGLAVDVRALLSNGVFKDKAQTPRPAELLNQQRESEKTPSMKEPHKSELASLGIAGLALLAGAPEVIRAAKRLPKGALERDFAQLKIWREMVKGKNEGAAEALDLALSHAEALELSNIALKKPAKKNAATKKNLPAAPARRRL